MDVRARKTQLYKAEHNTVISTSTVCIKLKARVTIKRRMVCTVYMYIVYYMCVTRGSSSPVSIARQRVPDEVMCLQDRGGGGGTKWKEKGSGKIKSDTEYLYTTAHAELKCESLITRECQVLVLVFDARI